MSSDTPSQNPFTSDPIPRKGETRQERTQRKREEARAKAVRDAIEEQIAQDKAASERYKKANKVLLLGQSESGKSTVVKNFQLMYAHDAWVQERSLWRIVIYLNFVQSVTTALEVMDKAMKEQQDRRESQQRLPSPPPSPDDREPSDNAAGDLAFTLSEKHRLLQLRLKPLPYIQRNLEEYLCSALGTDQVGTTLQTAFTAPGAVLLRGPRRHTEFSASGDGIEGARSAESTQDPHDTMEVLYCCGPDIKQLWADDDVQRLLKRTKQLMVHSRPSMIDVDRLLERDYEPSDLDVVKARLRTVGVQEYHFIIPAEKTVEDWILYDVCGSRSFRKVWCSSFDDINSVIFLAPVSCFDQYLAEDTGVNRLEDSLSLWKNLCNSKLLANAQLILFLNKIDLLEEKLKSGICFNKYVTSYGSRKNDVPSVTFFLKEKFRVILKQSGSVRLFNCHLTSAIDVKVTSTTMVTVRDGIIRDALKHKNLL